jgi:hypothetical protein
MPLITWGTSGVSRETLNALLVTSRVYGRVPCRLTLCRPSLLPYIR